MISVGGLKVYPAEVERVLLDHADVSQVAVVGAPEAVFGEQVVAFVVLSEDAQSPKQSFAQILQHAKANLAHYKVPRKLIPIDELPRNPSGKVLKTVLRQYDHTGHQRTLPMMIQLLSVTTKTSHPWSPHKTPPANASQTARSSARRQSRSNCQLVCAATGPANFRQRGTAVNRRTFSGHWTGFTDAC